MLYSNNYKSNEQIIQNHHQNLVSTELNKLESHEEGFLSYLKEIEKVIKEMEG